MKNFSRKRLRRNWADSNPLCVKDYNRFVKNQILIGIETLLNELDDPTNIQITVSALNNKYNIDSVDITLDYFEKEKSDAGCKLEAVDIACDFVRRY